MQDKDVNQIVIKATTEKAKLHGFYISHEMRKRIQKDLLNIKKSMSILGVTAEWRPAGNPQQTEDIDFEDVTHKRIGE